MKEPSFLLKHKFSSITSVINDTLIDNSDAKAASRRSVLFSTYLSGILTNLTAGTYFTGLMLAMGADEIFISYITIATTLCGFMQFLSPLLLERMPRRKPFLLLMRALYYLFDIVFLALIPILPLPKGLQLGLFMAAIILRNLLNAVSASGISIWQMQSIPPQKQTSYFTFSNLGSSIIGIATSFCASSLVDACETNTFTIFGAAPTITAILILRACAFVIIIPEMFFLSRVQEFPYAQSENKRDSRGLRLLLLPLTHKRFMLTISISFMWTFINAIIGEFYNVYLINIVNMSYTTISLAALFSTPMILLMTPVWSVLIRKLNWYRALPIAFVGYAFAFFFNVVITENTQYFYFVVMALCYIFNPCINIIFAYLPYINMPDTNRTAYISTSALCTTLVTFAANFFGNRFMYYTQGHDLHLFGAVITNYQYINLIQFSMLLLLALYVLLMGKSLGSSRGLPGCR